MMIQVVLGQLWKTHNPSCISVALKFFLAREMMTLKKIVTINCLKIKLYYLILLSSQIEQCQEKVEEENL